MLMNKKDIRKTWGVCRHGWWEIHLIFHLRKMMLENVREINGRGGKFAGSLLGKFHMF